MTFDDAVGLATFVLVWVLAIAAIYHATKGER